MPRATPAHSETVQDSDDAPVARRTRLGQSQTPSTTPKRTQPTRSVDENHKPRNEDKRSTRRKSGVVSPSKLEEKEQYKVVPKRGRGRPKQEPKESTATSIRDSDSSCDGSSDSDEGPGSPVFPSFEPKRKRSRFSMESDAESIASSQDSNSSASSSCSQSSSASGPIDLSQTSEKEEDERSRRRAKRENPEALRESSREEGRKASAAQRAKNQKKEEKYNDQYNEEETSSEEEEEEQQPNSRNINKPKVSKTAEELSTADIYLRACQSMLYSYTPLELPGRSDSTVKIEKLLKNAIAKEEGATVYICGKPGTGKTTVVRYCLGKLFEWEKNEQKKQQNASQLPTRMIVLNCMRVPNGKALLDNITAGSNEVNPSSLLPHDGVNEIFGSTILPSPSSSNAAPLIFDDPDAMMIEEASKLAAPSSEFTPIPLPDYPAYPTAVTAPVLHSVLEALFVTGKEHHSSASAPPKQKGRGKAAVVAPKKDTPEQPMTILVLDEADQLVNSNKDLLGVVLNIAHTPGSRLIVLAIANHVGLFDALIPILKSPPELVVFPPYSQQELMDILSSRLRNADPSGKGRALAFIQKPALELCARKIASSSGDLRKALDVCLFALKTIEDVVAPFHIKSFPSEASSASAPVAAGPSRKLPFVTIPVMSKLMQDKMGSQFLISIRALPYQQLLLLAVASKLAEHDKQPFTIHRLNMFLGHVLEDRKLDRQILSSFVDMLEALKEFGLLTINHNSTSRANASRSMDKSLVSPAGNPKNSSSTAIASISGASSPKKTSVHTAAAQPHNHVIAMNVAMDDVLFVAEETQSAIIVALLKDKLPEKLFFI